MKRTPAKLNTMPDHPIHALREKMHAASIDYYIVPAADAHQNEYVPPCWQRRAWLSGFTGSAGDLLIGQEAAYLWTDGRYFLQAEQQLNPTYFTLMKQQRGSPSMIEWVCTHTKSGLYCAVDPQLFTLHQAEQWQNALSNISGHLIAIEHNWIDTLWDTQPTLPMMPTELLDIRYTGLDTQDKLQQHRAALKSQNVEAEVLSRLDAIAWLFNLRGKDIDYNPLTLAYAIVTLDSATLFIDPKKITPEQLTYFKKRHITLQHYEAFGAALQQLNKPTWIDPRGTSWWTQQQLKKTPTLLTAPSPITLMKACKNKTEQQGMREAHRFDAIAMVQFLEWLEKNDDTERTECSAANQLERFRRANPRCQDLSFTTISGFADHGAIIHYTATPETDRPIDSSALYLVDSGGQYREGTTDITRTVHLGHPTPTEKKHYTLVLKGHLQLRHAIFPEGTTGDALDPYARQPIQEAGYDYAHGTGHGVGCYLCVHEGPQGISPIKSNVPLTAGMTVSNEPGLYFPGQYGIRIENVCLIVPTETPSTNSKITYFTLDDLTLVPYALNLIDTELLTDEEIKWINEYHHRIYTTLADDLPTHTAHWLKKATKPLKKNT